MTDGKKKQGEMAVMGDVVILLCILLSVGSQLVGMLVPGWWVYPANDSGSINASTTTYGLWVTVICVEGDCNEIPTDTSGSNAWLQVTQVFESVAVGFCLLAAACLVVTNLRSELELFLLLRRLSVFLLAASATSVLIGMAVFLKKSSGLARYPLRSTFVGRLEWPIAFSIVSACLTVFVAVIIGDKLRRQHQDSRRTSPSAQCRSGVSLACNTFSNNDGIILPWIVCARASTASSRQMMTKSVSSAASFCAEISDYLVQSMMTSVTNVVRL